MTAHPTEDQDLYSWEKGHIAGLYDDPRSPPYRIPDVLSWYAGRKAGLEKRAKMRCKPDRKRRRY